MNEKIRTILMTVSGILFAYILYNSYHFDNIFQIFFYLILGLPGLYLLFVTFYNDRKKYFINKRIKSFLPSSIGFILIFINLIIFFYYEHKLNLPTLLKAENHGLYAYFKKNGEYNIRSGSWASKTHFYGKYTINDSVITLDRSYFDKVLSSNKLIIRKVKNNKEIKFELLQADKNNKEISEKDSFEITEDNRSIK